MYGRDNIKQMPNFYDYNIWDEYMGNLWAKMIESCKLSPESTIIEVAPGATSKIAHSLQSLNFAGKLYIIEPHNEAAKIILEKTKKLLPKANIIVIKEKFSEVNINEKIDAILANHPFDDFISAYATTDSDKLKILFQDISKENAEVLKILKETWTNLSKNKNFLVETKTKIKNDWLDFISYHNPDKVILSQYSSSYFDKHQLSIINIHAKGLFKEIHSNTSNLKPRELVQNILNKNENYQNKWIGEELLNAENYLPNAEALHKKQKSMDRLYSCAQVNMVMERLVKSLLTLQKKEVH